jgi:hypothetical protein
MNPSEKKTFQAVKTILNSPTVRTVLIAVFTVTSSIISFGAGVSQTFRDIESTVTANADSVTTLEEAIVVIQAYVERDNIQDAELNAKLDTVLLLLSD